MLSFFITLDELTGYVSSNMILKLIARHVSIYMYMYKIIPYSYCNILGLVYL